MANSYRQFSFALKLKDKTEASWFRKLLSKAARTEDLESGGTLHDFEATVVVPNHSKDETIPHVWFQDNGEYGNVEQIATIVETYLKKFRPRGYFIMTWADTCSKHRLGEFGGGTAVVTSKKTHWFSESEFVKQVTKGKLFMRNA